MEVFCRLAADPSVCAFRSISILNNPCKYQIIFFSDERVSFSDYLAQLLSPNFIFQCNLFSSKTYLKGFFTCVPFLSPMA